MFAFKILLSNFLTKKKQHILNNQQRLRDEYRAENIDKIRGWISEDREKVKDMEQNQSISIRLQQKITNIVLTTLILNSNPGLAMIKLQRALKSMKY